MKPMKLYQQFAESIQPRENCQQSNNEEWFEKHTVLDPDHQHHQDRTKKSLTDIYYRNRLL